MQNWNDFFVATAGAAAALTGLIFVGVSISLAKILSIPGLANRALLSIILLLTILIISLLFLMPLRSIKPLVLYELITGFIVWLSIIKIDISIFREKEKKYKRFYLLNMAFNQIAVMPYLAGGIMILNTRVGGIYWIISAIIFSFIKAVLDAWVLLVEIHR